MIVLKPLSSVVCSNEVVHILQYTVGSLVRAAYLSSLIPFSWRCTYCNLTPWWE